MVDSSWGDDWDEQDEDGDIIRAHFFTGNMDADEGF